MNKKENAATCDQTNDGNILTDNKNTKITLKPQFDFNVFTPELLINHMSELKEESEPTPHADVLNHLLQQLKPLDFRSLAFPDAKRILIELEKVDPETDEAQEKLKKLDRLKVKNMHYIVLSVKNLLEIACQKRWNICKHNSFVYLFNGSYWANLDKEAFQKFLGEAAERMGVESITSLYYSTREALFRQFLATAYLPTPEPPLSSVFINLRNGTFEVSPAGNRLRPFDSSDFLTYQLPFDYDPKAKAPIFRKYIDRVLPDIQLQMVLSEYLGYVFIRHGSGSLKAEKTLMLHGTGANGKSVFSEIVNALLGPANVSSFSLQSLTNENGYYRAKLANKLVNYATEINGKLETSIFKQLVSGEPVEARLPYGEPFMITNYAKMIFNVNELPKDVEHTPAYFRRFLIIPFNVTIPEEEQDKQLHTKIINSELSGVFNWVLEGLDRLLKQHRFTDCDAIRQARDQYEKSSDTVRLFIEWGEYHTSPTEYILAKEAYSEYRIFCNEDGFKPLNKINFLKRLASIGIVTERRNVGNVVFITKDHF